MNWREQIPQPDLTTVLQPDNCFDGASGVFQIARVQTGATISARHDHFLTLAVAYFAIPAIIFLLGWVRPLVGVPVALIVLGGVVWLGVQKRTITRPELTQKSKLLVLLVAFFWPLLAGIGGVLPQSSDFVKHNLLFHDLVSCTWPVVYPLPAGENYLCYALGYYLVPALGGRLLGPDVIPAITFLWTFAGLALFFWWAASQTKSPGITLASILFFAPTGVLWAWIKAHGIPGVATVPELETKLLYGGLWFNGFDSFTRFHFQPQHALTGWLGAAILYEMLWAQKNPRGAIFGWVLCFFWSPLSCLGLLLVPLAAWRRVRWQDYFEPINLLAGGALLAVLGIYFQGHLPLPDKGFIGYFIPGAGWVFYYVLFIGLMFLPLLFLWLGQRKEENNREWQPLFYGAIIILLLLPLYKFGIYSDLRIQASAPALLFLALAAARIFQSPNFSLTRPRYLLLASALLLGAIFPVGHTLKNLVANSTDYSYATVAQFAGWRSLADMTDPRFDLAGQYQGRGNSLATRWLLRQNADRQP